MVDEQKGTRVRFRAEIESLEAYRQGKAADAHAYKLSSNENPFPPLPAVVTAIAELAHNINRYPDATAASLRQELARRFSCRDSEIHVAAGSVSILSQLILATSGALDEVIFSWRSFEAYPSLVTVSGAKSVQVPLRADGGNDLRAMSEAVTKKTRLIIVCSPNNPTGTTVKTTEFVTFMDTIPDTILVVLDEAYAEFVSDKDSVSGFAHLGRYPNLVVLRTFSKAYGLAGLRIGFARGNERILSAAAATAIPLSVTGLAVKAALVSLEHEDQLLSRVTTLCASRERLLGSLRDEGWNIPTSEANFVWFPLGKDTHFAAELAQEHGLIVRAFMDEGIRVTVAEESSLDKIMGWSRAVAEGLDTFHNARRVT